MLYVDARIENGTTNLKLDLSGSNCYLSPLQDIAPGATRVTAASVGGRAS
jgi:hypothetical protein